MSGEPTDTEPSMVSTLGYRLIRAAGVVHQHFARALATCGLSPLQHATLAWVGARGPVHQKALAELVNIDPGDLVKQLDALQERGLVVRERDVTDRRRQLVSLTADGVELLDLADARLARAEQECFADMAPRMRARLVDELTGVYLRSGEHPPTRPIDSFDIVEGRSALRAGHETV